MSMIISIENYGWLINGVRGYVSKPNLCSIRIFKSWILWVECVKRIDFVLRFYLKILISTKKISTDVQCQKSSNLLIDSLVSKLTDLFENYWAIIVVINKSYMWLLRCYYSKSYLFWSTYSEKGIKQWFQK